MEYYKNIEDMLTNQFEKDGERDDNGKLIKSTGQTISEKEWRDLKANILTKKMEGFIPQQSSEMKINYEELKNAIIENNWYQGERKYAAQLLWALRKNDLSTINRFLAFGNNAHHAISNAYHYDTLKKFGFEEIQFNEFGWIKHPHWLNIEKIKFGDDNNTITVGMGINEKWAYGFDCQNTTSGHFEGLNEWREPFTSKEAAIKEGIEKIKQFHTKALTDQSKPQKCRTIANKVLQKIKEYNNPVQGSIFDDVRKPNYVNTTKNKEMEQDRENYIPRIDVYDINKINPTKNKIGQGYLQNGHNKGFISSPIIWEINGFAYARHKKGYDLLFDNKDVPESFVPVNYSKTFKEFHALGVDEKHQKYSQFKKKDMKLTNEEIEEYHAEGLITDREKQEWLNENREKHPKLKVGQNYETDYRMEHKRNNLMDHSNEIENKFNNSQFKTGTTMQQKNLDYLANQMKYLGFGEEAKAELQKLLEEGKPKIDLMVKKVFDSKAVAYNLHFNKSSESDMYFLNSYTAKTSNGREQNVYLNKGKGFTAKETFNLMEGRAINKDIVTKEGKEMNAWIKLDKPEEGKEKSSRKIQMFSPQYGYDLEKAASQSPIEELNDPESKKNLLASLKKGNRQAVSFKMKDGNTERRFVEANPQQFNSLNIYHQNGKKEFIPNEKKQGISNNAGPIQKVTPAEKKTTGVTR